MVFLLLARVVSDRIEVGEPYVVHVQVSDHVLHVLSTPLVALRPFSFSLVGMLEYFLLETIAAVYEMCSTWNTNVNGVDTYRHRPIYNLVLYRSGSAEVEAQNIAVSVALWTFFSAGQWILLKLGARI